MARTTANLTKSFIERVPPAKAGARVEYWDDKVSGLLLRVTDKGTKSFSVYRRERGGKPIRVTLGRYPDYSPEAARREAKRVLAELAEGVNPNQKKRAQKASQITVRQVFEDYVVARKKLKPSSVEDYRKAMHQTFPDWLDMPMASITKEKVRARHEKRGKQSKARTNNAMRVLRALFNFAEEVYETESGESMFPVNPVRTLSKTKSWHEVKRRDTVIPESKLADWYAAVESLPEVRHKGFNETARMLLLFALFTGARRGEACRLKTEDVDLVNNTFTLRDTKNRRDVTLPMSDYLASLMKEWLTNSDNKWVFPGNDGPFLYPNKAIKAVAEKSVPFTMHDLRRTFLTIAESVDLSTLTIKRLVNHKTAEADVTSGYIIRDVDRMRIATNKITTKILGIAGKQGAADVIDFESFKSN